MRRIDAIGIVLGYVAIGAGLAFYDWRIASVTIGVLLLFGVVAQRIK